MKRVLGWSGRVLLRRTGRHMGQVRCTQAIRNMPFQKGRERAPSAGDKAWA